MKKSIQRRNSRLTALFLTLLMLALPLFSVFADGTTIPARVGGIYDNQVYMLKNKASGLYLTLPDYTETGRNVYQYSKRVNDQYSRAVTITYSPTNGLYTISSLLYENFGGGRVTFDATTDNVYLTQDANEGYSEWQIVYNPEYNAYRIFNSDNKAITALYSSPSSNIAVSDDADLARQLWEIEAVNVNPHLVKSTYDANDNPTIEKKNIGRGEEWLFTLAGSEMSSRSIMAVEAVTNPSLVEIAQNGNYFIAKINSNDDTAIDYYDNYSIVRVTLDNNTNRYVIVQDAGTGYNDACITLPMFRNPRLNTVTITEDKEFMVTLHSELGNVRIKEWIMNNSDVAEIATYNYSRLNGQSYAIIKAKGVGYTWITAVVDDGNDDPDDDVSYIKPIEVIEQYTDTNGNTVQMTDPNIINISTSSGIEQLEYNKEYLLKANSVINTSSGKPLSELWYFTDSSAATATMYGMNFILIQTERPENAEEDNTVTDKRYYEEYLSASFIGGEVELTLAFDKNRKLYLPNGDYYIQNAEDDTLFLQLSNDSTENYIRYGTFSNTLHKKWTFTHLENGNYTITATYGDGVTYALSLGADQKIIREQMTSTANIPDKHKWSITLDENGGYKLKNRATLEIAYISNAFLGIIEDSNYVYSIESTSEASRRWVFVYAINNDNYANEYKGPGLGDELFVSYWEKDPMVYVDIIENSLMSTCTAADINRIPLSIELAIEQWNNILGTNVQLTDNKEIANIIIRVTSEVEFENHYTIEIPNIDKDGAVYTPAGVTITTDKEYMYSIQSGDDISKVYQNKKVVIGLFYHLHPGAKTTMLHEFGHAMGHNGHSKDEDSVMYTENDRTILKSKYVTILEMVYEMERIGG